MSVFAVVGVNISVGNAAVQTTQDVSELLRDLANRVEQRQNLADLEDRSVPVYDVNGNRVGGLQVTGYCEVAD